MISRTIVQGLGLMLMFVMVAGEVLAATSAVVLTYRHFGEDGAPGNVGLQEFEAQLAELRTGRYSVLPLSQIVAAIAAGKSLPERTVAIAIDGAALSIWSEAFPRLVEAGLPFTVFVATDHLDRYEPERMGWHHLRRMAAAGVEIGTLGAAARNMADGDIGVIGEDIMRAARRFRTELGREPKLLSWPDGVTRAEVMRLAEMLGLSAAFGRHAGAMATGYDRFYLPRQMVGEGTAGITAFRRLATARPIQVTDLAPLDPRLTTNPPAFGFTVHEETLGALTCRSSHHGSMRIERLGDRVEVRAEHPFPPGRARIVCSDGIRSLGYDYWVPRRGERQRGGSEAAAAAANGSIGG